MNANTSLIIIEFDDKITPMTLAELKGKFYELMWNDPLYKKHFRYISVTDSHEVFDDPPSC